MTPKEILKIIYSLLKFLQSLKLNLVKLFYTNCPTFLRICFTFVMSEQCNKMIYEKIEEIKNEVYKDIKFTPPTHSALIRIYRLSMLASLLGDIRLKKEIEKLFRKLRNKYKESLSVNHHIIKFLDYIYDMWFEKILIIKPILSSFRLVNLIKKSGGITLRQELYEIFDLNFLTFFAKCLELRVIIKLSLLIILFIFASFFLYQNL